MSEVVNALFAIGSSEARSIFDEYETKGEGNHHANMGERQTLDVSVEGQHSSESLKLSILFLPPTEQAKVRGYAFGLVAKDRTPADRKDFEDLSIATITGHSREVAFSVYLDQPTDDSADMPSIRFELLNQSGSRISPTDQPSSFDVGPRDILTAIALAENGQPLIFPLFSGSTPFLTSKMDKVSLGVEVAGVEQTLTFQLK